MVEINGKAFFALIARLVLAWVFIQAGLPKIQDPVAFAASIEGYRIISGGWAMAAAIVLPWFELIIGLGLITPWLRRASAWSMAFLLGLFIALHISAWARGLNIDCGCFGEDASSPDYHWLILRNLALLIASLFVLHIAQRNKNTPESSL
ncbi:MAG: MauE/DoxX family redox-associated membrane protein [Opitutales bacterium]